MILRKTTVKDLDAIMELIEQGRASLKKMGVDQWQQGYPNEASILEDINNGESYVLERSGEIAATTMISFSGEKTYELIDNGQWLTSNAYGVLHRVAVSNSFKGTGSAELLLKGAEEICRSNKIKSLRVDTHENNLPMKKLLAKTGFDHCGIIYLAGNGTPKEPRDAFEKIIS
ncbi:MAG: GNAT family N-acetyltransferase [Turicibacter sp.]|nr:GNAT family N-acetyltransferase [Turicibacter sp.]